MKEILKQNGKIDGRYGLFNELEWYLWRMICRLNDIYKIVDKQKIDKRLSDVLMSGINVQIKRKIKENLLTLKQKGI